MRRTGWQPEPAAAGEMLVRGGFPELWADRTIPAREFYQSYVSTYLERDLRQVVNVGSLRDFERFLRSCAVRAGLLARHGAFASLDAVAAVLHSASGIVHVDVGLVGRMTGTRRLAVNRTAVSGFAIADFLPADD